MKVTFCTKEESNKASREEFLDLTPVERFNRFYGQHSPFSDNEFVLTRDNQKETSSSWTYSIGEQHGKNFA